MPKIKLAAAAAFLCLALAPCAFSAEPVRGRPAVSRSFPGGLARSFLGAQRSLSRKISSRLDAIKTGSDPAALRLLLSAAFIYGLLHALGPGHGKMVVASWFCAGKRPWWHAPLLGFEIAVLHVLSAVLLVLVTDNISRYLFGAGRGGGLYPVQLVSYSAITCIGLFLLWRARLPAGETPPRAAGLVPIALSVGIVPCAGALVVLFFAMAKDMLFTGIAAVAGMAAGIGLTLSVVGLACVTARHGAALLGSSSGPKAPPAWLRYVGPALITAVGAGLLLSALL